MIKIIAVDEIVAILQRKQLRNFLIELIDRLQRNFTRWPEFHKSPRHATHYPHGVIELMPTSDERYYSFKYVNGHPRNPQQKKLNVVAVGVLAEVNSGYPLLIAEMTLLTALRTAAVSAMASMYLSQANPQSLAIIGTGSQAEFQVLAQHFALGVQRIQYYDQDPAAMAKFANNLSSYPLELQAAADIPTAIANAAIITTATAAKQRTRILEDRWIQPGVCINAIGGDCPGKTELDPALLARSKIVVEHLAQTIHEGEIQQLPDKKIYAELWEIVSGKKPGRQTHDEVFIFDSVGFAIEDFTILQYVYELAQEYSLGQPSALIPELDDPKDLFKLCRSLPQSPQPLDGDYALHLKRV